VENDVDLVVRSLRDLGVSFDETDVDEFKDELYTILRESRRYDLKDYSFIDSLDDITYTFYRHKIRLPGALMLMLKVLTMMGDLGLLLDPEFNFIERVRPYLNKILLQNYLSPEQIQRVRTALTRDIMDLPRIIGDFIDDLSKGRACHRVDIPELEKIEDSIESASDRIFVGLLSSALILGVSLIITMLGTNWPDWYLYSLTLLGLLLVIILVR
jgi:ubiquinone biosynthesis protein